MLSGHLKLARRFFNHPFWLEKRKFSKAEAWIDILKNTQFSQEPIERLINGALVIQNRGEAIMSTRYCAQKWGWHKTAVIRYFKLLRRMEQVETICVHNVNKIIVLNYDTYNNNVSTDVPTDVSTNGPPTDHPCVQSKEGKEGKEGKEYTPEFLDFWLAYPKKHEKGYTFKCWKKIKNKRPKLDILLDAIDSQKKWRENSNGEFRPEWKNPSTWLNKGCWDDDVNSDQKNNSEDINRRFGVVK